MAGTVDTLGVIFAVFFVLAGIAIAVWYYSFRRPANVGGAQSCKRDVDCSGGTGSAFEQYTGQVCRSGTCQSIACIQNSTCAARAPGTTCFGLGPSGARTDQGCLPMACRTTDDCVAEGQDVSSANVVCVPSGEGENGICVPQTPLDGKGGCFAVTNLSAVGDRCVVCGTGAAPNCAAGSYCSNGRCLRCGDTENNLCEDQSGTDGPGGWDFCRIGATGTNSCSSSGFECKTQLPAGASGADAPIQLPNGQSLSPGVGICLPPDAECAFTWFNSTAAPTGSGPTPFAGQCPATSPYCSVNGTCEATPTSNGGAVCGYVPGVGSDGTVTLGSGDKYNLTGICSGILVPGGSYANPANFEINGTRIGSVKCNVGSANKAGDCSCNPSNSDCPEGTYCQPLTLSSTDGSPLGFCTISAGTGASSTLSSNSRVPLSGQLGHYYANSICAIPPRGGAARALPRCIPQPQPRDPTEVLALNGPGDFCYDKSQCLYNGMRQAVNNPLGALRCDTTLNRCVGFQ